MNWDDPRARFELIERVGAEEYARLFKQYWLTTIVATEGQHHIRNINSRFGKLYAVGSTGRAFYSLEEAKNYAREHPPRREKDDERSGDHPENDQAS